MRRRTARGRLALSKYLVFVGPHHLVCSWEKSHFSSGGYPGREKVASAHYSKEDRSMNSPLLRLASASMMGDAE